MALEAQDNPFTYITLVDTADPSTPTAGTKRLWVDTDDTLKIIDESAAVTTVGGGIANPLATDSLWDAKGDIVAATAANTAAKLTAGANDTILMADSGQTTGLKWVASQTPSTQAFADAAAEGTADTYARGDHKHAMMANPGGTLQTFTPTWIGGSPTIGDGSLTGFYQLIADKLYWICIVLVAGSTTNFGSGGVNYTFGNLPFTTRSTTPVRQTIAAQIIDSGTASFVAQTRFAQGATTTELTIAGDGAGSRHVTSTVPMTWANGDSMTSEGIVAVN